MVTIRHWRLWLWNYLVLESSYGQISERRSFESWFSSGSFYLTCRNRNCVLNGKVPIEGGIVLITYHVRIINATDHWWLRFPRFLEWRERDNAKHRSDRYLPPSILLWTLFKTFWNFYIRSYFSYKTQICFLNWRHSSLRSTWGEFILAVLKLYAKTNNYWKQEILKLKIINNFTSGGLLQGPTFIPIT